MRIIEKVDPGTISPPGSKTQAQLTTRERAIQALMGSKPIEEKIKASELPAHKLPGTSPAPRPDMQAQKDNSITPSEVSGEESASPVSPPPSEEPALEAAPVAEEPAAPPVSDHYQQLIKREKSLRAREQAVKAKEEAASKSYEEQLRAKESEYQSKYVSKDALKSDPLGVLGSEGLTYDQLTEMALKSPKTPEDVARDNRERALEAKLAALEAKLDKAAKSSEDAQSSAYQAALKQLSLETKKLVASAPDEFEAIKANNSYADVVELIKKTHEQDGYLLSVEEAARSVEDYLVSEGERMSRLKKIQARINKSVAASSSSTATPTKSPEQAPKPPVKNLTNANSVSSPQLSRRERAILAAQGKI